MNAKELFAMLSQYDPVKEWYIGTWTRIQGKVYKIDRIEVRDYHGALIS